MSDETTVIKQATLRLVKKAGGVKAAESLLDYSSTSVANSYSLDHSCTLQAHFIVTLEQFAGVPVVTREMARMQGYELHPIAGQVSHHEGFDALLLSAAKELGEAIGELQGRNHFDCMAVYHRAEKEALEAAQAAQLILDEVRRRDPRKRAQLRVAAAQ